MKKILELIKQTPPKNFFLDNSHSNKNFWYFTNEFNRRIPANTTVEISTNKVGWPRVCLLKKNHVPHDIYPASKMGLAEKIKLLKFLRGLEKNITDSNLVTNFKDKDLPDFSDDLKYDSTIDYIEYEE